MVKFASKLEQPGFSSSVWGWKDSRIVFIYLCIKTRDTYVNRWASLDLKDDITSKQIELEGSGFVRNLKF